VTRLWDRFSQRFAGRGLEPSGASIFSTTYGSPDNEPILPQLMSQTQYAYSSNAVVFGAILARLMLFSEAEFKFRRLQDKKLFGNQDLELLEYPWPNGTTGELLARMIQDADLTGNAYVWNNGEQLVRLRPDWVTIISELVDTGMGRQYRKVLGYWYEPPPNMGRNETAFALSVDEVAHWSPIPDPMASFRGMSWLTPVLREVQGDNAMTNYKIRYLENAASPNLMIKYADKLSPDQVASIRDRFAQRYGGVDNAFKTVVLDEGADIQVIGNTLEQMNFSTVQAAGENRIVIASGVPGIVIGSKEGLMAATYSNYEQAMRRFSDLTMRPLWRSVCACLAKLVTVPADAKLWFDTSDIAALRQGEKERAETMLVQAQAAAQLVDAFEPASVLSALGAGDMGQLQPIASTAPTSGLDPSAARNVVEMIQKVYLGVGTVITVEEARSILNAAGASLPAGAPAFAGPPSPAPALPPASTNGARP
jgi:HK97 family phage portal protein